MKKLIESIIKLRNPNFHLDSNVSIWFIISLVSEKTIEWLRAQKYRIVGKKWSLVFIGKHSVIKGVGSVEFGKWVKIGRGVKLFSLGREGIAIGNNSGIGDYSSLVVSMTLNQIGKGIKIGNNVGIGEYAYLGGAGGLEIGDDCIIGQYLSCHPENHNFNNVDQLIRLQGTTRIGITIGENCWIGSKVTICDGVKVGDGCVIAAGSVLTKSFPSNSVIGGVPARVLKSRKKNYIKAI
tara:strand:+ start:1203 stop:1913 length:711 start_codon:yes stop_codon:yes gene_type:complete